MVVDQERAEATHTGLSRLLSADRVRLFPTLVQEQNQPR